MAKRKNTRMFPREARRAARAEQVARAATVAISAASISARVNVSFSTAFGTVTYTADSVSVSANGAQLYAWAHRSGAEWPCSDLADLDSISAVFDASGLVDLEQSPAYDEETGESEVSGDEMNAWSADAIGAVLPVDHPCYFITVGQFGDESTRPDPLDGFDVDGFVVGYLDAILFTESARDSGYTDCSDCGQSLMGEGDSEPARECPHCGADNPSDVSLLSHGCSREDFTDAAVSEIRAECVDFLTGHIADVREYCELRGDPVSCSPDSFGRTSYSAAETAGTDFWFSRNGHGAGFFDRGSEEVYRRLQDAARVYGETSVYFDGEEITV